MAENINNTVLTSLIKGLKYNDKTDEYTFKHKKYKLREIKPSGKKIQESHLYFVNINEPTDLKLVKAIRSIPTYDGFNDVKVDSTLRKLAYQREYYKEVTLEKRKKESEKLKIKKAKVKAKKEEQKKIAKEKAKAKKLAKIQPIKCVFCGTEFKPKTKNQRFCCHECQLKYNSKKQADRIKEENKTEKTCAICGKKFIGTLKEVYCSKECYKLSQKENRRQRYEREKANGYYVKGGKYYYGDKNSGKKAIVVKKKNVK